MTQKFTETSATVKTGLFEYSSYAAEKAQENYTAVKGKVDDGTLT